MIASREESIGVLKVALLARDEMGEVLQARRPRLRSRVEEEPHVRVVVVQGVGCVGHALIVEPNVEILPADQRGPNLWRHQLSVSSQLSPARISLFVDQLLVLSFRYVLERTIRQLLPQTKLSDEERVLEFIMY